MTTNEPLQRPRVALIVPVLNEAEIIGAVLEEVPKELVDRLIVVDGGSTDTTREIALAKGAEVVTRSERGYGAACWNGLQAADDCQIIAFMDGDYSDPPAELQRLLRPLLDGQADLVLGARRFDPGSLPLHARMGNQLVLLLIWLTSGRRFADLPSFKVIWRSTLAGLDMRERTYGWTTEMIVKAARLQLPIVEVPIAYRERGGGRSKVSGTLRGTFGAGYRLILTALRYARFRPPTTAASRSAESC